MTILIRSSRPSIRCPRMPTRCPRMPSHLEGQIIAYDLAQILYRGHSSRKKRGPGKISIWLPFSNMAAIGYPEILFFAIKGQQMVEKNNYDNEFYVLTIANVQIML